MTVILITGGARSGKSLYAESRALELAGDGHAHYIATAEAGDAEMAARIARHQLRRGPAWRLNEAPLDLVGALDGSAGLGPHLVDCLTLWLSNLLCAGRDWEGEAAHLCDALGRCDDPVILVTNELGMGIVPDNALAREFRDAAGALNQMVATVADEVQFVVAGLPMKVK